MTITFAMMTTEESLDFSLRLAYLWILLAINFIFYFYWAASYLLIMFKTLAEFKIVRMVLNQSFRRDFFHKMRNSFFKHINRFKKINHSHIKSKLSSQQSKIQSIKIFQIYIGNNGKITK